MTITVAHTTYPTTWNEGADAALARLRAACEWSPLPCESPEHLQASFTALRFDVTEVFRQQFGLLIIEDIFQITTELAPYLNVDLTDGKLLDLLCRKQAGYGPHNITKFGLKGIAVRISDKVERLVNLTAQGRSGNDDESITDTVFDMAGYCVVAVMNEYGWMTLPLKVTA